jgi:hypothetical protein
MNLLLVDNLYSHHFLNIFINDDDTHRHVYILIITGYTNRVRNL